MSNVQWKKFENLAFEIQKKLSPKAIVKKNDKIKGKAGRTREIDISIRQNIGQFELLLIIDYKRYSIPVDMKAVESFIGMLQDVGAHQGALISATGYTKGAIERGRTAGINLYHLGNTLSDEISINMGLPSICIVSNLKRVSSRVSFSSAMQFKIPVPLIIYNQKGDPICTEQDVIRNWWFGKNRDFKPGAYTDYRIMSDEVFLLNGEALIPIELKVDILLEKLVFYRVLPIDFVGYKDVINDHYEMQQITTAPLSIESIKKDWILIDDSNLAVKPIITYGLSTINTFDL